MHVNTIDIGKRHVNTRDIGISKALKSLEIHKTQQYIYKKVKVKGQEVYIPFAHTQTVRVHRNLLCRALRVSSKKGVRRNKIKST